VLEQAEQGTWRVSVSCVSGWLVSMYHARSLCFSDPDSLFFFFLFYSVYTPHPGLVCFLVAVCLSSLSVPLYSPSFSPSVCESSAGRIGGLIGRTDLDSPSLASLAERILSHIAFPDGDRKMGARVQ
jgi:hypothetical protein